MAGVEGVMNAYSEVSPAGLDGRDPAELGQLTAAVGRVLPAIEEFWRFDGRDDAARRRPGGRLRGQHLFFKLDERRIRLRP